MVNPRPIQTIIDPETPQRDGRVVTTTTVNVDALQLLAGVAGDVHDGPGRNYLTAYAAGVHDVLAWLAGNSPDPMLASLLDLEA